MICLEMSRRYGLLTQATGVTSRRARPTNYQAGSEGGMSGLCRRARRRRLAHRLPAGFDGVQTTSLAKMVLDDEQVGALRRYIREDVVDETTALLGDILEVGIGGHYLSRRSTRRFARTEVWRPAVFRRGPDEASAAPQGALLERAVARAHELLATHDVLPLDDPAEREIEAILARWPKQRV
jgi:trimethylamine---corrinoid protein Co-methyltransferase